MKTSEDLTNENLKNIIINCGWEVEELSINLWRLSVDLCYKNKFTFDLELSEKVLNTIITLIKYCNNHNEEEYIEELIKQKGNKKYPKYKDIFEKSEIISWKLYKLALYLPKETAEEIDRLNK